MPDKIRILACDGGGIRGLLTAIWIRRLQSVRPDLLERVQLFAGTSTGGIIALALAKGLAIDDIVELYARNGAAIFQRDWRHWLGLTGAKYRNHNLRKQLQALFLDAELEDLRPVLIPSFQLDNHASPPERRWKPKFWTNMTPADRPMPVWQVALYTTAAPTYFPAVDGYVDGGLIANNPSLAALAEMLRAGSLPASVSLLSLGTGAAANWISDPTYNFGKKDVGTLVNMILGGNEDAVAFECKQLLGERACRFDPVLPVVRPLQIDDVERIPEIAALAESTDLQPVVAWLGNYW